MTSRKFSSVSLSSATMQNLAQIADKEFTPLGLSPSTADVISFLITYYRKNEKI